ncbi:hypothetical protein [Actinoplanes sp. NPDC051851]|uniref:hypothetical protein n=1 Tax=Actinoplanes sp. NPDC051851 TaxID=3154753 RepID=UPI003429B825
MEQHDETDPFEALKDWAAETERRVQRESRRGTLGRVLRVLGVTVVVAGVLAMAVPLVHSMLEDASPEAAPTVAVSEEPAVAGPFHGTPAAAYPVGEAGIVMPEPAAVQGFTAAQVESALGTVRSALIAGRLDDDMLTAHKPDTFLKTLSPTERQRVAKWFEGADFTGVATWIDRSVQLDPAEKPRVSGVVTVASATDDDGRRLIRITTNFIWVYAFIGQFNASPVAAVHDEIQWDFPDTTNLRDADRGMWIHSTTSYTALIDCDAIAKGLLAPTPLGNGEGITGDDPNELLRADHDMKIDGNC